jgi:hypothetical protein
MNEINAEETCTYVLLECKTNCWKRLSSGVAVRVTLPGHRNSVAVPSPDGIHKERSL